LYTDNQALQFITRQEKFNQRHAKRVEFMYNFTFIINHISVSANKNCRCFEKEMFDLAGIPSGDVEI
jgi:hypothetical protein